MRELTYTNSDGLSAVISNVAPFVLTKLSGFESAKNNVYTVKSVLQDGQTATGSSLDMSERTITGLMRADTLDGLEERRRCLSRVFSAKADGTLKYECNGLTKTCACKVETLTFGDIGIRSQAFDIVLLCPNPFWQDTEESIQEIAEWIGAFEFALEIPQGTGIEMGYRSPSLIVDVNNPGDVPCGMKIVFSALGTITNPSLLNVNTQEFIKVKKTMTAGETITITTEFGNKKILDLLNGVTSRVLNIDLDSTFLQLAVGDNLFRYNADSGLDMLECKIYYVPQYLGV